MPWLTAIEAFRPLWEPKIIIFMLVLTRISGLVLTAPILGAREAPMRARAFLAIALSFVIAPVVWNSPVEEPESLLQLGVLVGGELIIGATLGLGVMIIFTGIQVAGQLIGQVSGMALGDVFNPELNEDVHAVSQLLFYATMAVFVIVGGHRDVVAALLDTFAVLPPGSSSAPQSTLDALITLMEQSFTLGVRAAAPTLTALLLATVVLGLIARTLPQINALALGVPLNTTVAFAALAISVGAIVMVFEDQLGTVLETVTSAWQS